MKRTALAGGALLAAYCALLVALAIADSPAPVPYDPPQGAPVPEFADDPEFARTRDAILASRQAREVLSGRRFTFVRFFSSQQSGDGTTGVHIRLESPAEVTTNWLYLFCRGTRQFEQRVTWTSVQAISASVDSNGRLVGFGAFWDPGGAPGEGNGPTLKRAQSQRPATIIRKLPSHRALWRSSAGRDTREAARFVRCPAGMHDD